MSADSRQTALEAFMIEGIIFTFIKKTNKIFHSQYLALCADTRAASWEDLLKIFPDAYISIGEEPSAAWELPLFLCDLHHACSTNP